VLSNYKHSISLEFRCRNVLEFKP